MLHFFSTLMKTQLVRLSLILAILAGVTVTGLNVAKIKGKIVRLQSDLKSETAAHAHAEAEAAAATRTAESTAAMLKQTAAKLEFATAERAQAMERAADLQTQLDKQSKVLAATQKAQNEAQQYLARYQATSLEPEEVLRAAKELTEIRIALTAARETNRLQALRITSLQADNLQEIMLPASLNGRIIASDPKWQFVVLDAGQDQGMLNRGELLVSRAGKLVGKIKVTRVERERSIANVLPGWAIGELIEGDTVIPAHPGS
jgi:hypothetical protein